MPTIATPHAWLQTEIVSLYLKKNLPSHPDLSTILSHIDSIFFQVGSNYLTV